MVDGAASPEDAGPLQTAIELLRRWVWVGVHCVCVCVCVYAGPLQTAIERLRRCVWVAALVGDSFRWGVGDAIVSSFTGVCVCVCACVFSNRFSIYVLQCL